MFFSICSPICPSKRYFLFSCSRKGTLKKGIFLLSKSLYLRLLDNSPRSPSVLKNHNRHAISPSEIAHNYQISEEQKTWLNLWRTVWLTTTTGITHTWTAEATGDITSDVTCNTTIVTHLIFATYFLLICVIASKSGKLHAKFFLLYKRFQYVLAASEVWIISLIHY